MTARRNWILLGRNKTDREAFSTKDLQAEVPIGKLKKEPHSISDREVIKCIAVFDNRVRSFNSHPSYRRQFSAGRATMPITMVVIVKLENGDRYCPAGHFQPLNCQ